MSTTDEEENDDSEIFDQSQSQEEFSDEEQQEHELAYQEQCVTSIEYSSYRSKSQDSVARGTGVEKLCLPFDKNEISNETSTNIWFFETNGEKQTLIVSFENSLFVDQIDIYQASSENSVHMLEIFHPEMNMFLGMWKQTCPSNYALIENDIFRPKLRRYRFPSNRIRLTFYSDKNQSIGIRSIRMRGSNSFDTKKDQIPIKKAMAELYRRAIDNLDTDVEFSIDDKSVRAHRNIMCCRSTYFRALLSRNFTENNQTEPIKLTNVDYETFLQILQYIYTATFNSSISLELAIKIMFYADKINLITVKDAAIEKVCCHLRSDNKEILQIYRLIKELSPSFNVLLECIYELCVDNMKDICRRKEFEELEKDYMIDLVCQITTRRESRDKEKLVEVVEPIVIEDDSDSDTDDDF